jgi:hypothetical protein
METHMLKIPRYYSVEDPKYSSLPLKYAPV